VFVGRSLTDADSLPEEVVPRFVKLWEWYWSEFSEKERAPEQYAGFGWWLTCGKFETHWCLEMLVKVVDIATLVEPEFDVLEKLSKLAAEYPTLVMSITAKMVRGDQQGWRVISHKEDLFVILKEVMNRGDAEARAEAVKIIDHLGRRGYLKFGELLK